MDFHKLLMGHRYDELPAQTVLDEKVSKIIGTALIITMVATIVEAHVIAHQQNKIKKLRHIIVQQ